MDAPANFVTPAQQTKVGLVVGVPSFGMVSISFLQSCITMGLPINFTATYITPCNMVWNWEKSIIEPSAETWWLEVADARNCIARMALDNKSRFVFFRDDDTIAPGDAILKLYTWVQKTCRDNLPVPVVGGTYWSKSKPPAPLILLKDESGGFSNWAQGDIVKCMAIGMGCTLIDTKLFEKIPPPWFRTMKGEVDTYHPEVFGKEHIACTEDVYFCRLAAHYGHEIWCDTSIQCLHEDFPNRTYFYFHTGLKLPVWQRGMAVNFMPPIGTTEFRRHLETVRQARKPKVTGVKLHLGCGGDVKPGWVNVDLTVKHPEIVNLDITNTDQLAMTFGDVEEIYAQEVVEHLHPDKLVPTLRGWRKLLKPGGKIQTTCPDGDWCLENIQKYRKLESIDGGWFKDAGNRIFGSRRYPGDEHQQLMFREKVEDYFRAAGFEKIAIEFVRNADNCPEKGGDCIQGSLITTAYRPLSEPLENAIFGAPVTLQGSNGTGPVVSPSVAPVPPAPERLDDQPPLEVVCGQAVQAAG